VAELTRLNYIENAIL